MADEEKRLDQLLEKAKTSGKITIAEVQEASESLSLEPEHIMERCSAMQIELVDDDLSLEDASDPAVSLANDEISNDDSVKIYLKEIGRVALLTTEGLLGMGTAGIGHLETGQARKRETTKPERRYRDETKINGKEFDL